jgi:hypothetical protein
MAADQGSEVGPDGVDTVARANALGSTVVVAEMDDPPAVTVTVAAPTGVFEGRIAVIWLGET